MSDDWFKQQGAAEFARAAQRQDAVRQLEPGVTDVDCSTLSARIDELAARQVKLEKSNREGLMAVRQGLLAIVGWIERGLGIRRKK